MKISLRAKLALSNLASALWWKDAGLRALYSAVAIALPYLAATQLVAEVSWLTVISAGALGAVASLATSVAGLPEVEGVDLPWWLAAVERVVKTFGQALAAGLLGAVLLTDVEWGVVLQASALAALVSLLRLILATLPNDPTPPIAAIYAEGDDEVHDVSSLPPEPKHLGAHNV
ncbi:holin [Microbacterium trichothecenolyticum]|uniref:holin n=1 Tax=Microbacterium trichothecenolyticum TaxID=69370 RepID=UPI0035BE30F9